MVKVSLKKSIAALMCLTVLGNSSSVFAADSTQNVDTSKSVGCDVSATVGSSFSVVIPKSIALDGSTKKGAYAVTCTGDIAGNQYITVTPSATFAMKQTGKQDVTAKVTQTANKFRGNTYSSTLATGEVKMSTGATGAIDATGITAGNWSGTLSFTIAVNTD